MTDVADADAWVIIKRGLFFRPNCVGYTGIRDQAGRYSHEFAKSYEGGEVTIARLSDVPEFMEAAFDDLVLDHVLKQREHHQRRIAVLEMVIREELDDCQCEANQMIVDELRSRRTPRVSRPNGETP